MDSEEDWTAAGSSPDLKSAPKPLAAAVVISRDTPISDIVRALTIQGCEDLTERLDAASLTSQPAIRGGYGDVFRGILNSHAPVAIKALRVSVDPDDEAGKIPKRAARELYAWSRCRHPNVLPLLGLAVFQNQIRMVSSWMENGSLPGYLEKHPQLDPHDMARRFLHSRPALQQNVLVSDEGVPMITDFGNANVAGFTPRWTAPELLVDEEMTQSIEADVYALGMFKHGNTLTLASNLDNSGTVESSGDHHCVLTPLQEIVTGDIPYAEQRNDLKLIFAIGSRNLIPKRPEVHITDSPRGDALWSLLLRCWNSKPKERPSAEEVARTMKQIAGADFDHVPSDKPGEM
ncbi:hypothetical protein FRC07_013634 [Ceratobasidium sp. 392]|nr:hypothetical protein FRC07_013634 [Ceratobasidium sp. 392]